jgi:hypothetical protein
MKRVAIGGQPAVFGKKEEARLMPVAPLLPFSVQNLFLFVDYLVVRFDYVVGWLARALTAG